MSIAVLRFLFFLLLAACSPIQAAQPTTNPPVPVHTARMEAAAVRDASDYLGALKSRRSVNVQPQVAGWITAIHVVSGQHVTAGTLLMDIDMRRQLASVRSQEANRASKVASLNYWKQQYARLTRLYAGGGASKQELDSALSSLKGAEGDLLAQDQQVRSESVLLRYYKVVAAEEGTVGDVPVRVGDLVNTSTVLTTLDHNERLEAYVGVPVDHLGQLHKDLRVELLDDDGKPLAVTEVSFVSPEVAADQSVLVKSWVDNEAGRFRNNQLVRVRVVWAERQAPVIPVLAVQTRNGQNFAWVVKGDERTGLSVQERAIQVSAIQGQAYPIIKGLSVGERVVVSGLQKLHAGASVVEAPAASG